jgi:hypothetical protein
MAKIDSFKSGQIGGGAIAPAWYGSRVEHVTESLAETGAASAGSAPDGRYIKSYEPNKYPLSIVRAMDDLLEFSPTAAAIPSSGASRAIHLAKKNSGHYAYPPNKRAEIVQEYRAAQQRGEVANRDAWAQAQHGICGRTLGSYIKDIEAET